MASRPIAGQTFTFEIDLVSQSNTKVFQSNPTIASGDFQRSINGGSFANLDNTPTVTPSSSTQVQIILSASETTSAAAGGRIKVRGRDASGAEWCDISILLFVFATENDSLATAAQATAIEADTQDIQSRLPAALASGRMDSSVGAAQANTINASALATDAVTEIQSGLATSAALATVEGKIDTVDSVVDSIKAKTDNLPTDPADASDIAGAFGTVNSNLATVAGYIDTEVAAIKAKTDNLPASPAATGDIPSAAAIRSEIDANSTKLDVAVSTRLAAGSYTAPPSAAAVRAEIDANSTKLDAAVSSRATPAQVNAEVLDVLTTDTFAEPNGVPAATSSLKDKLAWLFTLARNKITQTSTTQTVRNDADSGNIATSTVSDDGSTATRGEWS